MEAMRLQDTLITTNTHTCAKYLHGYCKPKFKTLPSQ
jgi:hypothetical protein